LDFTCALREKRIATVSKEHRSGKNGVCLPGELAAKAGGFLALRFGRDAEQIPRRTSRQ
jgi:hypothetical protein